MPVLPKTGGPKPRTDNDCDATDVGLGLNGISWVPAYGNCQLTHPRWCWHRPGRAGGGLPQSWRAVPKQDRNGVVRDPSCRISYGRMLG